MSDLQPPQSASAPQDAAKDRLGQARALLDADRRQEVIDLLRPVVALQSSHAEAHFLLGTALLELGRLPDALPRLQRAAELAPGEWRYLYNLAVNHWMLDNLPRAAALCRQVVALHDYAPAREMLMRMEMPGEDYFNHLESLHRYLRPATYVEIGVFRGQSLRLVGPETQAIAVDPEPRLEQPPGPAQRVYAETSDHFFANHDVIAELGGRRIDMAFIDGMHHFEFVLRDFINIERLARPDSVVLVHDCLPFDAATAARERTTDIWSGDVWRAIVALKKYRPGLTVHTITTPPTGLGLILNLDPQSTLLADNFQAIVDEFMQVDYAAISDRKREALSVIPGDWPVIQQLLNARPRPPGA